MWAALWSSEVFAQRGCRLPQGSQDCVNKACADRELFIRCGASDWVTSLPCSCVALPCVMLPTSLRGCCLAGGRAGITFGVELVVSWDAPEAVFDLHSDGVLDLETAPDVIGLTGRRPGAAVCL